MMLKLIEEHGGDFRVSFSITGLLLDQLETGSPETMDSFKRLADSGSVEFLAETSHHSLAYLYSEDEFTAQVQAHRERIASTFGGEPVTFRNTELVYDNGLAAAAEAMGFDAVLAEGADRPLAGRNPNRIYRPAGCSRIVSLLKNYRLSDDIAFRFSSDDWKEYPLSPGKFADWVRRAGSEGDLVNLFLDYETLGEHHAAESGIFGFFESLPSEILGLSGFRFVTPAQAAEELEPAGEFDVPELTSWADMDRDLSAWRGNELQESALEAVYEIEDQVRTAGAEAIETWRRLQTSDHFYYMSTKWFADGDVHKYFNPYLSPYDAYVNYMNVLSDFTEDLEHG
jgi:alpha-amylase